MSKEKVKLKKKAVTLSHRALEQILLTLIRLSEVEDSRPLRVFTRYNLKALEAIREELGKAAMPGPQDEEQKRVRDYAELLDIDIEADVYQIDYAAIEKHLNGKAYLLLDALLLGGDDGVEIIEDDRCV